MRRYGRRLSEVDIAERIDLLRASFVGLDHTTDQKALRRSWSHVPESPYIYFLSERLTACSTLVCKMRERLENSYHHFSLAMQAGAFVQLIILFVAISSRMSVLSSELEEALQLSIATCNRLLRIIHPTGACVTTSQQLPPELETTHPSHVDHDVLSEDTGQIVSRHEPIDSATCIVEDPSTKVEMTLETGVTPPSSDPTTADDRTAAQTSKKERGDHLEGGPKASAQESKEKAG
ncbi:hypothetical protein JVU11DRAFT_6375 [Chiua virens]|nr:hypothetical protein JVU11DRAFT_6375 [Chiua virens]